MEQDSHIENLETFKSFFVDNQQRFFRFAMIYVGDRMAAEDIVMESVMNYWNNRDSIDFNKAKSYILTSIKNKSLNYLRYRKAHVDGNEPLDSLAQRRLSLDISTLEACEPSALYAKEIRAIINNVLNNLPENTRNIFYQHRYNQKSYAEIAEMTGLSVKGVEYHLSKAYKALRKSLEDYLPILVLFFSF